MVIFDKFQECYHSWHIVYSILMCVPASRRCFLSFHGHRWQIPRIASLLAHCIFNYELHTIMGFKLFDGQLWQIPKTFSSLNTSLSSFTPLCFGWPCGNFVVNASPMSWSLCCRHYKQVSWQGQTPYLATFLCCWCLNRSCACQAAHGGWWVGEGEGGGRGKGRGFFFCSTHVF